MLNKEQVEVEVKEAYKIIHNYIQHDIEAMQFVELYAKYIHQIDDIIDEDKKDELIINTFNLATCVFTTPFWIKHHEKLFLIDVLINNQYADVVKWESAEELWKRRDAKALSHVGYNMLFAVVLIVAGYPALRECSSKFRQWAHYKHLEDSEFKGELNYFN